MESKLLVKTPSSIIFPVTAKRSSLPNVFGSLKKPNSWNGEEKQCGVSLKLQKPQYLFTKENVDNVIRSNFVHKNKSAVWTNAVPEAMSHQSHAIVVPNELWDSFQRNFGAFCRFGRTTVMLTTVLTVFSMSLLTVEKMSDISLSFLTGMLPVIVAAVSMSIYLCGINHLSDIEVDKVNMPEYPIATGEFSVKTATTIVISTAIMGLSIPIFLGSWPLFWALFVCTFLLGFAYSVDLPFLRWKRSPLLTAICMLGNRSIPPMAYYWHMQTQVLGRPGVFSKPLIYVITITTTMMIVFGVFKDLSDIAGDKLDGVRSLPIIFGEKRIFKICVTLLQMIYFAAMLVGATFSNPWSRYLMVGGHAILSHILGNRIRSFDYSGSTAYKSFYGFLWKMLCVEYVLVQFAR